MRRATLRDARELERMLHAALLDVPPGLPGRRSRSQLLVLDIEGTLHAVERVTIDEELARGSVHLLVVDAPAGAAAREIEERMLGVGLAMCEAYGCARVQVTTEASSEARPGVASGGMGTEVGPGPIDRRAPWS